VRYVYGRIISSYLVGFGDRDSDGCKKRSTKMILNVVILLFENVTKSY